ncbi:MAG TPA: hypothetical protein VLV90_06480 [Burkholderiales bacterium]|nr:hypothetical protein [Burkholderiales bacterium]
MRKLLPLLLLAACSSGPVPPAWQASAKYSLEAFREAYLRGETRVADLEFARARAELASTGRAALVARAELIRCAARTASLEFDDCPGFEKLRADAGPEELAYADFLAGRAARAAAEDAFSRLVSAGVEFKGGKSGPLTIAAAIDLSSAQGWRRPLLAWLGVEEMRAEAAGDAAVLERIRRRIELVSGGR